MAPPPAPQNPPSALLTQAQVTQLQALDAHIAKAFADLTKDHPDVQIDPQGALSLIKIALNGNEITPKELDALLLLIDNHVFTKPALDLMEQAFVNDVVVQALSKGSGTVLKSDADLALVYNALAKAAAHVHFFSPGTGISYTADLYEAMKILLKSGDITVVRVRDRGIYDNKIEAFYDHVQNTLFLFQHTQIPELSIIHEMTHAIQDFLNIKSLTKYTELDAFIAEDVCDSAFPSGTVFDDVVKIANNKKAEASNKAWQAAYKDAALDVADMYKGKPENVDMTLGEKDDEKKKLNDVLNSIAAARIKNISNMFIPRILQP